MKNLNLSSKLVLISIILISLILILIYWSNQRNSIESKEVERVKSSLLDSKLLIVSQSSPFKDLVTNRVSGHYKTAEVDVVIIDVAALKNTDITEFDAILIVHRWEARAPAESVQSFMDKNTVIKNKIVMLTTSWNGLEKMNNVDAITGASVVDDVPIYVDEIIKRLDPLLKQKN